MADGSGTGISPQRRRFTVDEYYRMAAAGILQADERVELPDGEIQLAPIGGRHAACVNFLAEWFIRRLADRVWVSIHNPIRLSSGSEPEPEIALLRPRPDRYARGHPGPDAVLLLIEVADTSLRHDRQTKLPLYASAGIPEVWIVDLERERVLVYRTPHAGSYQHVATVARDGVLSPEAFPDLALRVDELLG